MWGENAEVDGVRDNKNFILTLQTMAEISVEKNSTIIFPAQFMTTVKEAIESIKSDNLIK